MKLSKYAGLTIGLLVVAAAITLFRYGYLTDPGIIGRHDISLLYGRFWQGEVFNQWFQTWSSEEVISGPRNGICYALFSPLYFLIGKLYPPAESLSIYVFIIYLLGAVSCYLFVYYYTRNVYASTAAGIFYAINWFSRRILGSGIDLAMGVALFPILFLLFDRALERGRFKDLIFFSIFAFIFITSSGYHSVYAAFTFLVLFALLHTFLSPGKWRTRLFKTAKPSLISLGLIFGLLAYQFVPFFNGVSAEALSVRYGAEEAATFTSSLAVTFTLENVGHQPPALGSPFFVLVTVLAALAFSALLFRRDKYTIFFAIAALIGIFLAKGPHPPLAVVFNWLWDHFPAFSTFRDSGRWLMLTSLAYAFLLGVSVKFILDKLKGSRWKQALLSTTLTGTLIAMVLLSVEPLLTTHRERGYNPNNYPEYVEAKEAYNKIASRDEGINSIYIIPRGFLILDESIMDPQYDEPFFQTQSPVRWLYPESGQPMAVPIRMDASVLRSQISRFMDSHIKGQSLADVSGILDSGNFKYIVLETKKGKRYVDFFKSQDNLKIFYEGEAVIVFENKSVLPHLRAAPTAAELFGGLNSLLALSATPDFSFNNINLLPPDSSPNADLLILYNADAEEFALLNAQESEGDVQRLNIDESAKLAWWRQLTKQALQGWMVSDWWTVKGAFVHGRLHLRTGAQAALEIPFSVDESGNYEMWLRIAFALNRGELGALVDGKQLPGFPLTPTSNFDYGFKFVKVPVHLEEGEHILELRNDGSEHNDVDEVFLIKSDGLGALTSATSQILPEKVIYYSEAERLFGLDNLRGWSTYSFVGPGKIIADDEQSQFWYVRKAEAEAILVADSTEIKVQGKDSLQIEVKDRERKVWTILQHRYDTPQDWSDYDGVSLYFYGRDTRRWFALEAVRETEPDWTWANFSWRDDFIGWRQLVFFIDKEKLDWTRVDRVIIGTDREPVIPGTWYIDDLRISKLTERPPAITIRSPEETFPTSVNFRPIRAGDYMVAIRALATEPPKVAQYSPVSTIADDRQSPFWEVILGVRDQVELSDSKDIKTQGEDSLQIKVVKSEKAAWTTLRHIYDAPQDWSDMDYISLYFYGSNTGQWFALEALTIDGKESKWQNFGWRDDFIGWKQLTFSIDKEKLDWSRIEAVVIGMDKPAVIGTWYLDDVALGQMKMVPAGYTPEQTRLHMTINGQSETFSGFTTQLQWLKVGPVYLDDNSQTIELSNDGEVLIDKIMFYPSERQSEVSSPFEIDNNTFLSYDKLSPTKYQIHINTDKPFWMIFSEVYHPLWYAYVDGESIQSTETFLNSYLAANSFYIPKTGEYDFTIEFKGQSYLRYGAIISFLTLGIMLIGGIFSEVRGRRKKRG